MERVIPMSWFNQMFIILSIVSASLCLIIQEWAGLTPLPIYVSIMWAVFILMVSIWLSLYLLKVALKANNPINIEFVNKWLYKKIASSLGLESIIWDNMRTVKENVKLEVPMKSDQAHNEKKVAARNSIRRIPVKGGKVVGVNDMVKEIKEKCISIWYRNISNEKIFPEEAQELAKKLLTRFLWKVNLIDKVKLTHKMGNVLLLHLKEYQRAVRRVERGAAPNVEDAYRCLHPGSRNLPALEHMLHRLITVLAQEFLQWELTSSLPCKLLLSILAKKLLLTIETVSCPTWIFQSLSDLLLSIPNERTNTTDNANNNTKLNTKPCAQPPDTKDTISVALCDGITSVTAAVIPRSLPKTTTSVAPPATSDTTDTITKTKTPRPSLHLENLSVEHRGLWGGSASEADSELDEDRISPVYEESTDFATTIAKLRSVLQQKSNVTTPFQMEEKSYVICEGSQFTNLSIPWTEFHTAPDGSQQLLYCIQFDDIEQRGVDLFETTTATVRRQYIDFVQLHASLEEISSLDYVMSDLVLPEGGRVELESYLKTLCTRLANECPPQLRHFLRPNSITGKKADAVAPRFDRFLAKTVSGVFNTLKTVVPGFEVDQEEESIPFPTLMSLADIPWRFVEDIKSKNLAVALEQLVADKTEYCSVDSAYEAVDSIDGGDNSDSLAHWWETVNTAYDEELDELDGGLALTCTVLDLVCELLTGIGSTNTLQQAAVIRWTKLLLGNITEPLLQEIILSISTHLGNFGLPRDLQNDESKESTAQTKNKLSTQLLARVPSDVKLIFGEDDIQKIFNYLLDSREVRKVNMDLNLQILDVFASQLLISCKTNHESVAHQ